MVSFRSTSHAVPRSTSPGRTVATLLCCWAVPGLLAACATSPTGRNQLMLDMCNPEVVAYLYEQLKDVFTRGEVSYVKWDMNRNLSDIWSNYML